MIIKFKLFAWQRICHTCLIGPQVCHRACRRFAIGLAVGLPPLANNDVMHIQKVEVFFHIKNCCYHFLIDSVLLQSGKEDRGSRKKRDEITDLKLESGDTQDLQKHIRTYRPPKDATQPRYVSRGVRACLDDED